MDDGPSLTFCGTTSPNVSVEITLVVDWARVTSARVGTHVVIALIVLIRISLRTLWLGCNQLLIFDSPSMQMACS